MPTATAPDGTSLNWTSTGSGPPVVLVHGITENLTFWEPVVERLESTNQVVRLDLRGHGESGLADTYSLEAMAGDVASVAADANLDRPHLVGHSLGGIVVSALGAGFPTASVVNVDQSLQLAEFQAMLKPFEAQLRNADTFPLVMGGLFDQLAGPMLSQGDKERMAGARRPIQEVVMGVWELILSSPLDEIAATVDGALSGYAGSTEPYLALFGADPGDGYGDWLQERIPSSAVELWDDHGHYPHLVDPDRFVARLHEFWG